MRDKSAKWSIWTAGWLGVVFGFVNLWVRGTFQDPEVVGSYVNIAAVISGSAGGGAALFMVAAAIRNAFGR